MTTYYWDSPKSVKFRPQSARYNHRSRVEGWSPIPRAPYALYPELDDLNR